MGIFTRIADSMKERFLSRIDDNDVIMEAANRKAKKNTYDGVIPHEQLNVSANIAKWKTAVDAALNNEEPDRIGLYNVYRNVLIDNHLSSIIESRILKITGSPFKIVDDKGEENTDLTKIFEAKWFTSFIKHVISSKFHGETLIEIILGEEGISRCELIPRSNCNFKKQVIFLNPDDEKGVPYAKPPLSNTIIDIGNFYDLGLLYKAAPIALAKKFALGSWGEYAEKFGIPFRYVTTDTTNDVRAKKLGAIMKAMGSAGWGVFRSGEEVKIMDTPGTSAHEVFNKLIDRTNTEMSKLILGQTMTTDNGSSKSQAEVHKEVAGDRHLSDKMFVKNVVNTELIPRLRLLGIAIPEGYLFDWDNAENLSIEKMVETITKLSSYYDIDTDYITEKTGIPILGVKSTPILGSDSGNAEKKKNEPKQLSFNIPIMMVGNCCGPVANVTMDEDKLKAIQDDLLKSIFEGLTTISNPDYLNYLKNELTEGLTNGFTDIGNVNYNQPDHIAKAFMEANIARFSAAKNLAMVNELNGILNESNSFGEFKENAKGVLKEFNVNHLKTEYNLARSVAQNASRYYRQQENIEAVPYYIYKTAADNRVRPSHAVLHNKTFKKDDPAVNAIYPPNGFRDRCEMVETHEVPKGHKLHTGKEAKELLQKAEVDKNGVSEWDRMRKGRFNVNKGELKTVFDENQFYVKNNFEGVFNIKNNGLKKHQDINQDQFPKLETKKTSQAEALEWFNSKVGNHDLNDNENIRLTDFSKKPITVNKKAFKRRLNGAKRDQVEFIDQVIQKPDEVYLVNDGHGKLGFRYIKFYQDEALTVFTKLNKSKDLIELHSWEALNAPDGKRKGILIKQSSYE